MNSAYNANDDTVCVCVTNSTPRKKYDQSIIYQTSLIINTICDSGEYPVSATK